MTVFSFHPVKPITTAEGGAVTTRDQVLADKLRLYRSHGITRDPQALLMPSPGEWYYEQQLLGFNYRLTDIQAALGLSQLSRLDQFITQRRELARRYDALLSPCQSSRCSRVIIARAVITSMSFRWLNAIRCLPACVLPALASTFTIFLSQPSPTTVGWDMIQQPIRAHKPTIREQSLFHCSRL